jgi:hypothetical protein
MHKIRAEQIEDRGSSGYVCPVTNIGHGSMEDQDMVSLVTHETEEMVNRDIALARTIP